MTQLEPESGSVIPPEWQGYCDIYMQRLRERFVEQTTRKGTSALERAIGYFSGNPDALLREVQTQFSLRPSYFGIDESVVALDEATAKPVAEPIAEESSYRQKRAKEVGPEEAAIIDEIEQRFATEELLKAIKSGQLLKGSKS